ncbi:MAG: type I-U CRISPR-associated RAMP protein Csb1/Cas7u [Candidatus Polarisedimenticolia bacterium]
MTAKLDELANLIEAGAVAVRRVRRFGPAGGAGDKVFPPTYVVDDPKAQTKYAIETRRIDGAAVDTVLLDSVQSQANRMEQALLAGWRAGELSFPVIVVDFSNEKGLEDIGQITTLDAPHRLADAILRDSTTAKGVPFRQSGEGLAFTRAKVARATAVFKLCPTALIFGVWDSTGATGGMGAKFARTLVSEIVGVNACAGVKTASRIDPLQISDVSKGNPLYEDAEEGWTFEKPSGKSAKPQALKPSDVNHGNIAPSVDAKAGGVTLDYALHTAVLSLAGLRKLGFPVDCSGRTLDGAQRAKAESAARTALAALALAGVVYQDAMGYDLRSRCLLVPEGVAQFEVVAADGRVHGLTMSREDAQKAVADAAAAAANCGMGWACEPGKPILTLKPTEKLCELIRISRAQAATSKE